MIPQFHTIRINLFLGHLIIISFKKKKNSKSEIENVFAVATDTGLESKPCATKNHVLPFKWDTHTSYTTTACIKYVFTPCLLCLNKNLDKNWSLWQYKSDLCTGSTTFHSNLGRDGYPTKLNTTWEPNTEYVSGKYLQRVFKCAFLSKKQATVKATWFSPSLCADYTIIDYPPLLFSQREIYGLQEFKALCMNLKSTQ